MIDNGSRRWQYSTDTLYIGGKRIKEVYVGNKKVYPDTYTYPISFAMYVRFDRYVISRYSDTPVNEYGCRLYIDEEHSDYRYADVEKVAFVWAYDSHDKIWNRHLYVRFKDGIMLSTYYENPYVLYDPFVADNEHIIKEGLDDGMRTWPLHEKTSGAINFLYSGPMEADMEDKDGNLLTNYITNVYTDNASRLFYNTDDAIRYILS
jgi:hypothetical protein